jgi:hypothetical protein
LVGWIRRVHESNDASASGIVQAVGFATIVARAPDDAILGVLDALAALHGLSTPSGRRIRTSKDVAQPVSIFDLSRETSPSFTEDTPVAEAIAERRTRDTPAPSMPTSPPPAPVPVAPARKGPPPLPPTARTGRKLA